MQFLTWVLGGMLFCIWTVIAFSLGAMGGAESARRDYAEKQRELTRRMQDVSKN